MNIFKVQWKAQCSKIQLPPHESRIEAQNKKIKKIFVRISISDFLLLIHFLYTTIQLLDNYTRHCNWVSLVFKVVFFFPINLIISQKKFYKKNYLAKIIHSGVCWKKVKGNNSNIITTYHCQNKAEIARKVTKRK